MCTVSVIIDCAFDNNKGYITAEAEVDGQHWEKSGKKNTSEPYISCRAYIYPRRQQQFDGRPCVLDKAAGYGANNNCWRECPNSYRPRTVCCCPTWAQQQQNNIRPDRCCPPQHSIIFLYFQFHSSVVQQRDPHGFPMPSTSSADVSISSVNRRL